LAHIEHSAIDDALGDDVQFDVAEREDEGEWAHGIRLAAHPDKD
jgi:hypothetical protein